MFPVLVIAIGLAVLVFGKRLAVLGAAVGALLGLAFLHVFPMSGDPLLLLVVPGLMAIIGFFVAGFAKGIVNLVVLAMGALAGAAIVLAVLDLFSFNSGLMDWLLALIGAVVGLILVRRYKEPALIVLAGVIGALLVTRGLTVWFPAMQGALGTVVAVVLAGGGIAYQSGMLGKRGAGADGSAGSAPTPPAP